MKQSLKKFFLRKTISFALSIFCGILSIVLAVYLTGLDHQTLEDPIAYSGDGLWMLSFMKGLAQSDWQPFLSFPKSPLLGWPDHYNTADFPQPEHLFFLLMKLISCFTSSPAIIFKVYFLLTFALSSMSSFFAFRWYRIAYPVSFILSVLFAILPYHFIRIWHLNLASYFLIPLQTLILFWIHSKTSLFLSPTREKIHFSLYAKKSKLALLILLLSASAGIYYLFFFSFLYSVMGVAASIQRKSIRPLASIIPIALITCVGVGANLLPNTLYSLKNGKNSELGQRSIKDSEIYSLKLSYAILPFPFHRSTILSTLSKQYQSATPVTEGYSEYIGLTATLGFFILVLYLIFGQGRSSLLFYLSIAQAFLLLFSLFGGFNSAFSVLVNPSIRCGNRTSVILAFFGLFAVAILLNKLYRRASSRGLLSLSASLLLISAVFGFGIYDQTAPQLKFTGNKTKYLSDQDFFQAIEKISKPGTKILQIPYLPFPEAGAINDMIDYSHFRGYLHSNWLIWSYGSLKTRPKSIEVERLSKLPLDIKKVKACGFSGIYIDRFGFKDRAAAAEMEFRNSLGVEPIVSHNKRLSYFPLIESAGTESGN